MSKKVAVRIDSLADVALDLPGALLRIERRFWTDGSSCLNVAKWGLQPKTGRLAPWWQPQYSQVRWEEAPAVLAAWVEAARTGSDVEIPLAEGALDDQDGDLFLRVKWSETGDFAQLEKLVRRPSGKVEVYLPIQRLILARVAMVQAIEAIQEAVAAYQVAA